MRCKRCEDGDGEWWGPLVGFGAVSPTYEAEEPPVLLDQHGNPFPREPKLVGYERRVSYGD